VPCHFGFDQNGQRLYIQLNEAVQYLQEHTSSKLAARKQGQLKIYHEDHIKHDKAEYMIASLGYNSLYHCDDFTAINELCVGNFKLCLSNERILKSSKEDLTHQNAIFDNISLIVNCHMKDVNKSYYHVATKEVCSYPIHNISLKKKDPVVVYQKLNEKIWQYIQTGNVFVHCLAGVHRAASVVVSHFLWRYYYLNHRHLEKNIENIYQYLKSIRPGVEPLSYVRYVIAFEAHLKKLSKEL